MVTDYTIQISDSGYKNVADESTVLSAIDYVDLRVKSINDEENVLINEQTSHRKTDYVFDYQTNTRNGIMSPRFTIRGVIPDSEKAVIHTLKTMRKRDTIKYLRSTLPLFKQDPDYDTANDRMTVQFSNITFTVSSMTPNATQFTIQAQGVNQ